MQKKVLCSENNSSDGTEFSLSCCSVLSCCRYCPLKFALLVGEIPTAFLGSQPTLRMGDAFEPATSILVMAVAAPARASVSGSYFASSLWALQ